MDLNKEKSEEILTSSSLWPESINSSIKFPKKGFHELLADMGWKFSDWISFWMSLDAENLASNYWSKGTRKDWVWGLGIPLLTQIKNSCNLENSKRIIGISALPGCGKSSLGRWLEESSNQIGIDINVISLDDFYFTGEELDKVMKDNPWNVPRGIPGSHDIQLLEDTILQWIDSGKLLAPKFDKSLRNGMGDRSTWINTQPKILIIEGWFLGCKPLKVKGNKTDLFTPKLTDLEIKYREKIQHSLKQYLPIWELIHRIWHIRATDFSSTFKWKVDQENEMFHQRGSALQGKSLKTFVRMIETAIPQESLNTIDSSVLIDINQLREILYVGRPF
ncbi:MULTISPECIES: uridine kinase [Prochlorococcus]|uniref:uridine kinase n=1 Tax=Prochlorococcus TaxID=1218 RepID=UPI000533B342|nr:MULTISPECIES: uridine kinase [Prochlorococcus]KGG12658.1 D-glycerate 3-kinase [Prochlorococcus sp. MIT 0601]